VLLGRPAILAAGRLQGLELFDSGTVRLGVDVAIAAGLAFVSALISIALLMAWLQRSGFGPFVIYRVILGGGLLYLHYGGFIGG